MGSRKRRGFYEDWEKETRDQRFSSKTERMDVGMTEMQIPNGCVGLVIGRNGSEIQHIIDTTGCRAVVRPEETRIPGYRTVELHGTEESIDMARRHINGLVSTRMHITKDVMIPAKRCGFVIGKGGETMRKLRTSTKCQMNLIQESKLADASKPLRISGPSEFVKLAEQLVKNILDSDTSASQNMAANGPEQQSKLILKVPRETVGAIMGRNGEKIKKLAEATWTKVQFLDDEDPMLMERSIIIIGSHDNIQNAASHIRSIVVANNINSRILGPVSLFYLTIPANKCGLVIGRGGDVIKQIISESGAHCELSREPEIDPREKTFVIRGTDRQIEHAKHLISMKLGDIPMMTPFIWKSKGGWEMPPSSQQSLRPTQQPIRVHQAPQLQYPIVPQPEYPYFPQLPYLQAPPYQAPPTFPGLFAQPNLPVMFESLREIMAKPHEEPEVPQDPFHSFPSIIQDQVPNAMKYLINLISEVEKESDGRTARRVDYTDQWMKYYRNLGDEAGMASVRKQMAKNKRFP